MSEPLGRRGVLAVLAALALAVLVGLIAWGPVVLDERVHAYADTRAWGLLPHAGNVLASLPLLMAAAWGWFTTRASRWGTELRRPWAGFHVCAAAAAVMAALYHAAPRDETFVLAHVLTAAGFVLLTLGVLAERVDARFGSVRALLGALVLVLGAATLVGLRSALGLGIDMRPLLLLQVLPVLLIPAGALWLPGAHTRASDWLIVLVAYAAAKVFDAADAAVLETTGWIGGHALMHLSIAALTAWLAYCAAAARAGSAGSASRRHTSLNTSG